MGFPSFTTPAGLSALEDHLTHVSYIEGYTPSQADVAVFKALPSAPDATTYPHSSRWYTHIQSWETEHETLPGDASKPHTAYGPSSSVAEPVEPVEVTQAKADAPAEDDDEIDLFGSDEEDDAAAEKLKAERVAAYTAKKATKAKTIAKSLVTLDVKPWDDETDMVQLEANIRKIEKPGLVWGLSKLVPIGYGIKKLQMTIVIEDDLVGVDDLQEEIALDEEHVQSTDVVAMAKI